MKNKKGFTLVELLAVIVILALIMSIAVVSIGGVLNSTRQNTFKETAVSIINGVRQQLIINNKLDEGDYVFTSSILEKGGKTAPLGGNFLIADTCSSNQIGNNICKIATGTCSTVSTGTNAGKSFVRVTKSTDNVFTYSICLLTDGGKSIIFDSAAANNSTEANLLNNSNNSMIKDTPTT